MKSPAGLTTARIAEVLEKVSGSPVPESFILDDVAAGAPANPDGTVNLIRYAAWLLKHHRDDRD